MLTRQEIVALRRFMLRVEPTGGVPIARLIPELSAWRSCMEALEREEKVLAAASNDKAEPVQDTAGGSSS